VNLRPRRHQQLDINLTPLIDVVFLLLIFFMVSTTFEKETRIEVELPQAQAVTDNPERDEKLEILIDPSGRFFVNDQQVLGRDPQVLEGAVVAAVAERDDLPVMIKADGQAPYQAVITAMDVLTRLGLNRMSFIASRTPKDD
jgi:biopolymer transport protein ExbD